MVDVELGEARRSTSSAADNDSESPRAARRVEPSGRPGPSRRGPGPNGTTKSFGSKKIWSSAWVNARIRNRTCRGAISFRYAFPMTAMPERAAPVAPRPTSGRTRGSSPAPSPGAGTPAPPPVTPKSIANIRLNGRGTLERGRAAGGAPHPVRADDLRDLRGGVRPSTPSGRTFSSTVSARNDVWHASHVTSGSVKFSRWPEARTTASGSDLRRVDEVVVVGEADEPGRPGLLDAPLQRRAERPVVVEPLRPAVDLGRRPEHAAATEQREQLVDSSSPQRPPGCRSRAGR